MPKQKIAIIHDPLSQYAQAWKHWLESESMGVDMISDESTFISSRMNAYDLAIPLITIKDFVTQPNARIEALKYFNNQGVKLLTPYSAIEASSDKLITSLKLNEQSLPHPSTTRLDDFSWASNRNPIVIKPRFGHSGANIHLMRNRQDCAAYLNKGMLAQEYIKNAECIRVIASSHAILSAYKKASAKGELIVSIDRGAKRTPLALSSEMENLAKSAVKALGGGLMGVDLLSAPEGLFVLEANVPFGFDIHDDNLRKRLAEYIAQEIQ